MGAALVQQRYGLDIHRTTVMRAMKKKTTRDGRRAGQRSSAQKMMLCKRCMRMRAVRCWRSGSRLLGVGANSAVWSGGLASRLPE